MNKKIIVSLLTISLASISAFTAILTPNKNIEVTILDANKVHPHKFKSLKITDGYYTGLNKITYGRYRYYQNIVYDHMADNIEDAWAQYTGKGVTVAIIDTGLDINHPDFANNVSELSASFYTRYNDNYTQYRVYKDVGKQYLYHDKYIDEDTREQTIEPHGTNVAGTALAEMNGVGTVGVAPEATLLALKVDLDDYSINEAIKYAVDNGAKVINMSFGAYATAYYDHYLQQWFDSEDDYDPMAATSMINALNYAHAHDVILVAAAGNEATPTHSYPACNDYVIGVGALDMDSSTIKAPYSNYNLERDTPKTNPSVDVMAPGTVIAPDCELNRFGQTNSTYTLTQGTSFASPIVAGLAALWLEKYPNGTPLEFETALFNSTKDIGYAGWDTTFGYGAVQANTLLSYNLDDSGVEEVRATSIRFFNYSLSIYPKTVNELSVIIEPSNHTNKVSYISSDDTIAYVSNSGVLTAVKEGNCVITASIDGLSATLNVKVTNNINIFDGGVFGFATFCGGDVVTTSTILSLISLLGIGLILNKKKQK